MGSGVENALLFCGYFGKIIWCCKMSEEYGNIPDGFLLNPEEVNELRKSKRELTDYAKQKLKELIEKQEAQND